MDMFGFASVILALAAALLVSGLAEIPVWPGISAGLVAMVLAWLEIRRKESSNNPLSGRKIAWVGLCLGGLSALVGLVLYVGAWMWAAQGN